MFKFKAGDLVRIKKGWDKAGRLGKVLGESIIYRDIEWTPVIWEEEEDPDWNKTIGLELFEFHSAPSHK